MNRQLASAIELLVQGLLSPFGSRRRDMALAQLVPKLTPVLRVDTARGSLKLACDSRRSLYWARFFSRHEPDTLAWIDRFQAGDVFWDVGANVGIYSLYAGMNPDTTNLAFEPGAANYHALNRNILLNGLQDRIAAYCFAFTDRTELGTMTLTSPEAGGDMNLYGGGKDSWGHIPTTRILQHTLGLSIDDFITRFRPPFPNHLKIDVDGVEDKILRGAQRTLADTRLKSLLVEFPDLDNARSQVMRRDIDAAGLALDHVVAHCSHWHDLIFLRR